MPTSPTPTFRTLVAAALLCLGVAGTAAAEEPRAGGLSCPTHQPVPERPTVEEGLGPEDIYITADSVEVSPDGVSRLEGAAEITRGRQQVRADALEFNEAENEAELRGNIDYWDDSLYLHSDGAHVDFDTETATVSGAGYRLVKGRGRGTAAELTHQLDGLSTGSDVQYTTCDAVSEGGRLATEGWTLTARSMTLHHDTDRGSARDVVIRMNEFPIFYSPYISFPLSDKRKSGFLVPGIGSTSNNGVDIRIPYYWNIAPNYDATLIPRVLTDSGVMPTGEFRYLVGEGGGEVNVEYLPDDDNADGADRHFIGFIHDQGFADTGELFLTYNGVSDDRYFEDFGTQLSHTSVRFLERRADASYRGDWWTMRGRVHDYRIIDDSIPDQSKPYTRLPQFTVNAFPLHGPNRVNAGAEAEFSYFVRDEAVTLPESADGFRMDVYPSISYPFQAASGFLTPKVGVRYTHYSLDERGQFIDAEPERLLPIASVDAGLFFERDFAFAGSSYIQTLEPRAYYLYIPHENQDDLPVFDSGIFNVSYYSMFRENRFTGPDRIGDANQLTFAVASRLIDPGSGREHGLFRIGQTYYLEDQDILTRAFNPQGVLVDIGRARTDLLGPLVTELRLYGIGDWNLGGEFQWDPERDTTEKLVLQAQYLPGNGTVLNLAYRARRGAAGAFRQRLIDIEQTDVSFRVPLTARWGVVGRWNHAISEGKSLELFAGIEYESCCWGLRAVARRFLTNLEGDYQTGVFLQLELKGLAGIGKKTVDFLSQRIPGYEEEF